MRFSIRLLAPIQPARCSSVGGQQPFGWPAVSVAILAGVLSGCNSSPQSPTAPVPIPASATRVIDLCCQTVTTVSVGGSVDLTFTVGAFGDDALTVTGIKVQGLPTDLVSLNWSAGRIFPGTRETVTLRVSPTAPRTFTATITVEGNQTGGNNSITWVRSEPR